MERRGFIKLITALGVIAVVSPLSLLKSEDKFQRFYLVGDGVTDNTKALQAAIDGYDDVFYSDGSSIVQYDLKGNRSIHIKPGNYIINKQIINHKGK